jgi:hypothetical protein
LPASGGDSLLIITSLLERWRIRKYSRTKWG